MAFCHESQFTFDDAYRSVLDVAGPILKAANAPSVFFVNPATVTDSFLPVDNVLSIAIEEFGGKEWCPSYTSTIQASHQPANC